ncbi:MAG: DUF1835 domain-containing protein [Pyrinomonadaceae bacterium]
MILHVLPGDSLSKRFENTGIKGKVVVCREAFISGDLDGDDLDQFWESRANYHSIDDGSDPIEYQETVARELEQLLDTSAGDEVNLWFEYELFCSVNMWFCIGLLKDNDVDLFRVAPINVSPDDVWEGFGQHSEDELIQCLDARVQFTQEDRSRGIQLWEAYRDRNVSTLSELGNYRSAAFPFLKEVCDAAVEVDSKPLEFVKQLKANGFNEIETLFPEFRKMAGVYGFGDVQVESLLRQA